MVVPENLISASTAVMQETLGGALDRDWRVAAGGLDWSCRDTAGHIADALFTYASQVVARPSDGYLPIEARVKAAATPESLLECVVVCGELLRLAVSSAPRRDARMAPLRHVRSRGVRGHGDHRGARAHVRHLPWTRDRLGPSARTQPAGARSALPGRATRAAVRSPAVVHRSGGPG
jgi:hypothetical protein